MSRPRGCLICIHDQHITCLRMRALRYFCQRQLFDRQSANLMTSRVPNHFLLLSMDSKPITRFLSAQTSWVLVWPHAGAHKIRRHTLVVKASMPTQCRAKHTSAQGLPGRLWWWPKSVRLRPLLAAPINSLINYWLHDKLQWRA